MASDDEKKPLLGVHYKEPAPPSPKSSMILTTKVPFFTTYVQPCCAEFVGTAMFVFIATMSQQNELLLATAIGSGLSLAMLIYSFGQISGGHFNPAVTLGIALCQGMPVVLAPVYIIVQLVGGILGAAFTRGVLSFTGNVTFVKTGEPDRSVYYQISGGTNLIGSNDNYEATAFAAILSETLFTYILVTVYLLVSVDTKTKSPSGGLAIGLAVTSGIVAGGMVTEGCMNPARALGPAVVITDLRPEVWYQHYVYWVGPILGALVAALLYRLLFAHEDRRLGCKSNS